MVFFTHSFGISSAFLVKVFSVAFLSGCNFPTRDSTSAIECLGGSLESSLYLLAIFISVFFISSSLLRALCFFLRAGLG